MRSILTALLTLCLSAPCCGQGKIRTPFLGFDTVDFSTEFWASLKDDHRFKGKVGSALVYEDLEKIVVLRCNMHVPIGDYLERTIRNSIAAHQQFVVGPVPERVSRDLRFPLLTALFETKKGDLGLLTLYSGMTIVELNGRYGMILER